MTTPNERAAKTEARRQAVRDRDDFVKMSPDAVLAMIDDSLAANTDGPR